MGFAEETERGERRRFGVGSVLRIVVSLVFVWLVCRRVDLGQMAEIVAQAQPTFLFLGLASMFLERIEGAYRWYVLVRVDDPDVDFRTLLRILFVSNFYGNFLPGGGVEVIRTVALRRSKSSLSVSFASVALDRAFGLGTLLITAVVGCWLAGVWIPLALARWVWAGLIASVVGLLAFMSARVRSWTGGLVPKRFAARAETLGVYLDSLGRRPALVAWAIVLALGIQVIRVVSVWMLGLALGIEVPAMVYFAFVPITIIAQLLPVGVGGLGLREGAFVVLFGTVGVSAEAALALSLVVYASTIVTTLPGALAWRPR